MNKLLLLFGVLICLVAVNARHYVDQGAEDASDDQENLKPREHRSGHRKRRWQSSYGYDYPPPSYYYPERRDDRNNQETIQNIYRLLEDISSYLRRMPPPPPPPQPIYIPYPVPFSTKVSCTPQNTTPQSTTDPDVGSRNNFTDYMDQNRNWGIVAPQPFDVGNENDGARPISFVPLIPRQTMKRPAPKVEHGSQQASHSTDAPHFVAAPQTAGLIEQSDDAKSSPVVPGICNAAILSCCGISDDQAKQQCFANVGCSEAYTDGNVCTSDSIQRALDTFRVAYSPVQ